MWALLCVLGGTLMSADAFFKNAAAVLLDDAAQFAYYGSVLPGAKDDEITRLVEQYLASAPAERAKIAAGLDESQASWLGTYAHRMALLSVRRKSPAVLRNAIVALLMAAKGKDPRECTMTMSVLYRAAQLLGLGDAAFRDAAVEAPDADAQALLLGFLNRADPDKTVEAMGYRELTGKNGLVIVYGQTAVPAGW
jgi:hypothetical protein